MAERIEIVDVTIPAGTALATPVTRALNVPDGVWATIEMRWPPGPSGLVGLRIAHSGQVIIPRTGSAFLVTDDEAIIWNVEGYPSGNKWTVIGYNTDVNDHTVQFRIHVNEIPAGRPGGIQLVPIG